MKKISLIKSKKYVIYAKRNLLLMTMIKMHLNYTIKSEIIVTILENIEELSHSICNLRYKTPKEIPVVFHNGSTYDYHFISNELPKEFEGQYVCLGENAEKFITFSVPIKKELDNVKKITYKLEFIDSCRFMSTSFSKLADYLSEIYSNKCRDKNCKSECEFKGPKNNKVSYNCNGCGKKQLKLINRLIKKFPNT